VAEDDERPEVREARYQAFWMLRLAFTAIPLTMGIDKYFNGLVSWPKYLADCGSTTSCPARPSR
jgi:hypothetical protein